MKDFPRIFPVWFLPLVVLIAFCVAQCGCITKRGNKIGGGYIKGDDGVYRKPKSTQILQPAKPLPPKRVPLKAAYEPPNTDAIKNHSALPAKEHKDVKGVGKPEKLSPTTLEPRKKIGLGLITIELPDDNEDETSTPTGATSTGSSGATAETIENTDKVKVNWVELFLFYLNVIVVLCFAYMIYKIIKGEVQWKTPEIKKHLDRMGKKNVKRKRNTKKT